MKTSDIISQLISWTPFLIEGFAWNIVISLLAIVLGTALGGILTWAQLSQQPWLSKISLMVSEGVFKIPTIALMFYCAVLLPNEIMVPGTPWVYPFPSWIKAALALSAAQVGFTSHNLLIAVKFWRNANRPAALLLVPAWGSNLLITIIASSAASLVGVNEIVSRCNKVLSASQNSDLMLPMYLYTSLFFLAFCYPLTMLIKKIKQVLTQRLAAASPQAA
jgi:polar amino acid transport system permease protein